MTNHPQFVLPCRIAGSGNYPPPACYPLYLLIVPVILNCLQHCNDNRYPACVIHLSPLWSAARDAPLFVKRKETEYSRPVPRAEIKGDHHTSPPLSNAACSIVNMAGTRSGKSLTTLLVCGSKCAMRSSRMPRP